MNITKGQIDIIGNVILCGFLLIVVGFLTYYVYEIWTTGIDLFDLYKLGFFLLLGGIAAALLTVTITFLVKLFENIRREYGT